MEDISLLSSESITYDVIIIGAGIAGLAASKVLKKNGISYIILEANNKLGGRAKRAPKNFGKWFDLGCSYLHNGDINPLVKILESKSTPVCKSKGDMFSVEKTNFLFNDLAASADKVMFIKKADEQFKNKLSYAEKYDSDQALSWCLEEGSPLYPIFFNHLTGLNGIEPNFVSIKDYAKVKDGPDFYIESGLANAIEKWGSGLKIRYNSTVHQVSWAENIIQVETKEALFKTRKLLVTTSTGVLSTNMINFSPSLPSYKIAAIHNLPMGILNKVGVLLKSRTFQITDEGWYVACSQDEKAKIFSIMSYEIRTKPLNHIIIFFGGKEGKELENDPERFFTRIRSVLSKTFGHAFQERIIKFIHSSWGLNDFTLGSYSYALPGTSNDRELLKKSLNKKLFFAGEATSDYYYGTCHGAYLSGIHAAEEIISEFDT